MPAQKPGRSKQDYQTPREFVLAVYKYLHIQRFTLDIAASAENAIAEPYYTEQDDAFTQGLTWKSEGWSWLNPPFARIAPWVEKAYQETCQGARIAVLVPAGVGSNWWANWVHHKAHVLLLSPRLTFVGAKDPYPKDCALLLYGCVPADYECWRWK